MVTEGLRCLQTLARHVDNMVPLMRAIPAAMAALRVHANAVEVAAPALALLANLGCDQYQGFYFSPALSSAQFVALVRQARAVQPSLTDEEAARTHSKLAGLKRSRR